MNPTISTIIPNHDNDKYIKESIDSALSQTYRTIEVIEVDEGQQIIKVGHQKSIPYVHHS